MCHANLPNEQYKITKDQFRVTAAIHMGLPAVPLCIPLIMMPVGTRLVRKSADSDEETDDDEKEAVDALGFNVSSTRRVQLGACQ